jgi:hypothetical protein
MPSEILVSGIQLVSYGSAEGARVVLGDELAPAFR